MENTEIKSEKKDVKNQIVLKNLTKQQKEILSTAGVIGAGIGLGGGLFSLYSMNEPDAIPAMLKPTNEESQQANLTESETNESITLLTKNPVHEISDVNISFSEAFKTAREIVGPGGWFIWKENVYNTYFKEEWQSLSEPEKIEYLATVDVLPSSEKSNSIVPDELLANTQTIGNTDQITNEPHSEEINIETPLAETVTEEKFKIDFQDLYGQKTPDSSENLQPIAETELPLQEELIIGEIITLDDDTDLKQQGIFELSDDIEITVLPFEESTKLDSLIIDSEEITEFPWGESVNETATQIIETNDEVIAENTPSETENEITATEKPQEVEEYPWGEPVEKKEPLASTASTPDQPEIVQETINPIISTPEEITEYPWGETVTPIQPTAQTEDFGQIVDEVQDLAHQSPLPPSFNDVEEFPWGEKNTHFEPLAEIKNTETTGELVYDKSEAETENIGVIIDDLNKLDSQTLLPPSYNDITEYPWGESVLNPPIGHNLNESSDTFANHGNAFNDGEELP